MFDNDCYDFFSALPDCWEVLKKSDEPILIYGMGNGAEKILDECQRQGIRISGIFCSNDFKGGKDFRGYKVKTLREAEAENRSFTVLLGFGTSLPEVMKQIDDIEKRHRLFAPEVSVIGGEAFSKEKFLSNFSNAQKVLKLLADDESKEIFKYLTAYKITGRLEYLRTAFEISEKAPEPFTLDSNEIYCDMGAYNGDTITEFVKATNGKYRRIYAVEPEKRNFQKCVKNCIKLDSIEFYNAAAWDRDCEIAFDTGSGRQAKISGTGNGRISGRSLDSILSGRECTYIKYDVEGADIPALKGSAEAIGKFAPKLRCALYHRCYDYIDIPLFISSLHDGYHFFLRQASYYPAWETEIFVNAQCTMHNAQLL